MKKSIIYFFVFIMVSALFFGCDDDFDVNEEYTDITVVYGLLNQTETTHYIKINKAFLGDGDALVLAKDQENILYQDSLEVKLIPMKNGQQAGPAILFDTVWVKIDNSDPGPFYNPEFPNQPVFKGTGVLDEELTYKLYIKNTSTGKEITSETGLVKDFSILKPYGGQKYYGFTGLNPTTIELNSAENGKLYQMVIRFTYYEKEKTAGAVEEKKHVDWVFPTQKSTNANGGEKLYYDVLGVNFYKNLAAKLEENHNVDRWMDSLFFIFSVGADEFSTYIDVNKPSNTVIQERPQYTNINNGIGLFSGRYVKTRAMLLANRSEDSLIYGSHTNHLSFIKTVGP